VGADLNQVHGRERLDGSEAGRTFPGLRGLKGAAGALRALRALRPGEIGRTPGEIAKTGAYISRRNIISPRTCMSGASSIKP